MKKKCEVCSCGCEDAVDFWHCIVFNKTICQICCAFDMDADEYLGIKNPRKLCIKAQCPVCYREELDKFVLDRSYMGPAQVISGLDAKRFAKEEIANRKKLAPKKKVSKAVRTFCRILAKNDRALSSMAKKFLTGI